MELYILDTGFNIAGMIDNAESVLWYKRYNDTGECEIYIACDNDMINLLQVDRYIYRYDDDMICRIVSREIKTDVENGDYLIVKGKSADELLKGRIVWNTINHDGTAANFIKRVLNENAISPTNTSRTISNLVIDNASFNALIDTLSKQATHDEVLQLIIDTCKSFNYGYKVSFNPTTEKLVFALYKGSDKSTPTSANYIEFSEDYGNILTTDYTEDKSNLKTMYLIGGVGEGAERRYTTMGYGSSTSRRELFVNASSVSDKISLEELQEQYPNGIVSGNDFVVAGVVFATLEENTTYKMQNIMYTPLLKAYATDYTEDYKYTEDFTGEVDTVDTYVYGVDYNLGDIVMVKSEYGISRAARITEIQESEDTDNGHLLVPVFTFTE